MQIRQSARWAFDLVRFGAGPAERLCAALILAAFFVLTVLGISLAAKLGRDYGLMLAGVTLVSVIGTSAVLVLWTLSDERLEAERERLGEELIGLREREAEVGDAVAEEDAKREEAAEHVRGEREEAAEHERGERERGERERDEREQAQREARRPRTKKCPFCREVIPIRALKCRHCGEILDEELARERNRTWSPGVAAVLSFVIPGLGQIYKGKVLAGLVWFFLIDFVYTVSILGTLFCFIGLLGLPIALMLHVICLFDAASAN